MSIHALANLIKRLTVKAGDRLGQTIYFSQQAEKGHVIELIKSLRPLQAGYALVRLGPAHDGGYLLPNDLDGIEACFSPGVRQVSSFEQDCYRHGMKLFLADASIDTPVVNDLQFDFIKKFVGGATQGNVITLDDWVKSCPLESSSDLLLQMDIEGHEYIALLATSEELLNRFRIIVVEFHNLDNLWEWHFFHLAQSTFRKTLKNHTCVHIHANNCSKASLRKGIAIPPVMEFTFLRNDRVRGPRTPCVLPHSLDARNIELPEYPNVLVPPIWYKDDI